jgi:hypothetical protein
MTNPMLTWYQGEVLDQIPERLGLDPTYEIATDLTFRDTHGGWWRPQRDGSWIRHHDTGWVRGHRPAALEGMTPLPVGLASSASGFDESSESAGPDGPADALERGVARIVELYRSGAMVSTMAELALSDRKLIAEDGSVWTVGAQSRAWYRHGDGAWQRGERPPDSFLSGDDARIVAEAAGSPLQCWAKDGPLLPESITAPWNAPSPPEALIATAPAAPPPPPAAHIWTPSHTVPTSGMQTWAQPDPAGAVIADLAGGLELTVVERRADWARVRAENGWEGWVDGRRLIAAAPAAPPPPEAPPPTPVPTAPESTRQRDRWLVAAAIVLVFTAFLPWHSADSFYGETEGSQASAAFLWDYEAEESYFVIAQLILLIGAAALASQFTERLRRYRSAMGWIAFGISALWIIQTFRYIDAWNADFAESTIDLFGAEFAIGPWLALIAGAVLALKRRARV